MSGFCGWTGTPPDHAHAILDGMVSGLAGRDARTHDRRVTDSLALHAVSADSATALAAAPEGISVALHGQPTLTNERYAATARTHGTPAAIAEAFLAESDGCLRHLCGGFAVAILDRRNGTACLAIDRMGIHALTYAHTPNGLVFATSLDALRRHPWVEAEVGPRGVYRYVMNTVSPAPRTIYDDCDKLLPGHRLWDRGDGTIVQERYWAPAYGPIERRRDADLEAELLDRLGTAVDRSMAGTAPARRGAFLSGGLDSSVIAGMLQARQDNPLAAFTISFDDARYDERAYARAAAGHFGLDHREYALTPDDVVAVVPELSRAFDEPFGNSSVIPAHACARMAKAAGVERLFAGDGGDEIFAGNKRYQEQKILGVYDRLPALARIGLSAATRLAPTTGASLPAKAGRYVRRARMPMPERMVNPMLFRRDALAGIFTPDALAALDVEEPYAIWQRHYDEAATDDPIYAMQHFDLRVALADNDLRKVGRACEMAGVDVAYPMLDPDLVEFAARIPASKLIRRFDLRHFFKNAMRDFLPAKVLAKSKHGFGMPFPAWTRTDARLRDLVDDAITGLKARGIFQPAFLDTMRSAHRYRAGSVYDLIIYDLLMLELWQRERERPVAAATSESTPIQWAVAS